MKVRRSRPAAGTSLALMLQVRIGAAVVGAAHARVEPAAAFADPTYPSRGDAGDEGVGRDVLRDDGSRSNHRAPTNCNAADNRRVGADRRAVLDLCGDDIPILRSSTWIQVVRETRVRTDEDSVSYRKASVQGREVLDFALVSDDDVNINVHIFADVAPLTDFRTFTDLSAVPN